MQLEKKLFEFREENVWLKELLAQSETDFNILNKKYLEMSTLLSKYYRIYKLQFKQEHKQLSEKSIDFTKDIEHTREYNVLSRNLKIQQGNMESECDQRFKQQEQKYREIIDDLTNELASLSDQVSLVQEEFDQNEIQPFEGTLQELESQNDLLQKTIGDLELKVLRYESDLKSNEIQIQQLNSQITSLQTNIDKKTAKYEDLQSQYQALLQILDSQKRRCNCGAAQSFQLDSKESIQSQGRKPQDLVHIFELLDRKTEELKAIKEYTSDEKNRLTMANFDLQDKVKQSEIKICLLEKTIERRDEDLRVANTRLIGFAQKDDEKHLKEMVEGLSHELGEVKAIRRERETNLIGELNTTRQNLNDQLKALSKANDTIMNLERQAFSYRKQGDAANKENAILKGEVFKFKEILATQEGLEKSLREQLRNTQDELSSLKQEIDHYTVTNEELENMKRNCNRLKESNYDLVRKYNDLVEDYNTLEEEYRKLLDIKDQLMKEIESTRTWQREQKQQDQLIETKIRKLEEHINTLMDDRQNLILKIDELHRDAVLIGGELEHYKDVFTDTLSETQARTCLALDLESRTDNADAVIRKVRRTAMKLSQTRSIWQSGMRRFSD